MSARHPEAIGMLAAAALACAIALPYARAELSPPQGRSFPGTFFFTDDFCQYLSFAEQAARGELLFRNKFDPRPHDPFLVNVGWTLMGAAGAALGDLARGAHLVAILAFLGLGAGLARLAYEAGARGWGIAWSTTLALTAGGLEWLSRGRDPAGELGADLLLIFPSIQALTASGHTLFGLCLLAWSLILFDDWSRERRRPWPWLLTASILGLSRPFDFAVSVLVAGVLLATRGTLRNALRRATTLIWLAPVAVYNGLAFLAHPSFALWSSAQNRVPVPTLGSLTLMLGPVLVLALIPRRVDATDESALRLIRTWAAVVLAGLLLPALDFQLQFATSLGAALALAAAAATPRRFLPWAALALATNSLILYALIARPPTAWFPPSDYEMAAEHLAGECQPHQRVYAPSDPSLFIAAFTPCDVIFGHRVLTWDMARRARESEVFYDRQTSPGWRQDYLERMGADYVLLPAGGGTWLNETAPYVRTLTTPILEVWRRANPAPPRL